MVISQGTLLVLKIINKIVFIHNNFENEDANHSEFFTKMYLKFLDGGFWRGWTAPFGLSRLLA